MTLLNPAAARILKTKESVEIGRSVAEVVRHHELIDLWHRCPTGLEQSAAVEVGTELFLQAVITPFQDDNTSGYLVILQDLTQFAIWKRFAAILSAIFRMNCARRWPHCGQWWRRCKMAR